MQSTLAQKLRVTRARKGLTLRQAAAKLSVTPGTLSELERGLRHPHDVTLSRIAKGYGVPVEELLEEPVPLGEASQEPGPPAGDDVPDEERHPLIVMFDSWTKRLTEQAGSHWSRIKNLSEDLSPEEAFAVYQWVAEFIYQCELDEWALQQSGVMTAAASYRARVHREESLPRDLEQAVNDFYSAYERLFVRVVFDARSWESRQYKRPEIKEFGKEKEERALDRLANKHGVFHLGRQRERKEKRMPGSEPPTLDPTLEMQA